MSTMHTQAPSENWDDDFEFAGASAQQRRATSIDGNAPPRHSIASSRFTEDWDDPHHASNHQVKRQSQAPVFEDKLNLAGPSTPTKRTTVPPQQHTEQETENWDDDFDLDSNSPARRSSPRKPPTTPSRIVQHPLDAGPRRKTPRKRNTRENWDDDFELEESDDEDAEFGFNGDEEDRTVTARSRRGVLARTTPHQPSPPPPVPPLPNLSINALNSNYHASGTEQPFPRSPTTSVFSVPATTTSGRDSVAGYSYYTTNSQTHLSLGPSVSRTSAGRAGRLSDLPPSPPIHKERERRRLRKKSRPPRLEEGVFELVEQSEPGTHVNPKRFSGSSSSARASFDSQRSSDLDGSTGMRRSSPLRLSEVPEAESSRAGSSRDAEQEQENSLPKDTGKTKAPLLSRIGSVGKRWAVRRKRASTAPSEVVLNEDGIIPAYDIDAEDTTRTPRPPSSLSQTLTHPPPPLPPSFTAGSSSQPIPITQVPPNHHQRRIPSQPSSPSPKQGQPSSHSNSWFFRTSSKETNGTGTSSSSNASLSDLRELREKRSVGFGNCSSPSPVLKGADDDAGNGTPGSMGSGQSGGSGGIASFLLNSPSKLVKRKSLGFVQLRSRTKPQDTDGASSPSSPPPNSGVFPSPALAPSHSTSSSNVSSTSSPSATPKKNTQQALGIGLGARPASMYPQPSQSQSSQGQGQGQPRHASYGASQDKAGRGSRSGSSMEKRERSRTRSVSRSKDRSGEAKGKDSDNGGESGGKDKEKEGTRGFMGGMRRISLVGKHKRSKSAASLAFVGEASPGGPDASQDHPIPDLPREAVMMMNIHATAEAGQVEDDAEKDTHKTPSRSNILLPPIELQPPSPPRAGDPDIIMKVSNSAPAGSLGSGIESLLAPSQSTRTSTFSPLPTITSGHSTPSPSPASPSSGVSPTSPLSSPSPLSSTSHRSPASTKSPGSPGQAASLGRTAGVGMSSSVIAVGIGGTSASNGSASVPRRNSLGDLKIPARISQAQVGLKRDLGMVREFAANIEQLKDLQSEYHSLVLEVQGILDAQAQAFAQQPTPAPTRSMSPTAIFPFGRRHRSNTNPSTPGPHTTPSHNAYKQLASAFYTLNSRYRITWECAELLIELAGGTPASATSGPTSSVSAPIVQSVGSASGSDMWKGRERAITLAGDESKPSTPTPGSAPSSQHGPPLASPPNMSWRASTGRHDLSQRQLVLLKEMLSNADSSFIGEDAANFSIAEEAGATATVVNRDWRWGDAMSSTITLPSEETSASGSGNAQAKKRRSSRLGMTGLRDLLRSLKRNHSESLPATPPVPSSTVSLSTDESLDGHDSRGYPRNIPSQGRRRSKTSTDPESMRSAKDVRATSPYGQTTSLAKSSPRRPSLASIFRLGQKHKHTPPSAEPAATGSNLSIGNSAESNGRISRQGTSESMGDEEDWDRIDSTEDLDAAARALGLGLGNEGSSTLRGRGRSPYFQLDQRPPSTPSSRPVTPKRTASSSQSSLAWDPSMPPRSTKLSNVEEHADDTPNAEQRRQKRRSVSKNKARPSASPSRPPSRSQKFISSVSKNGSVRSMPVQSGLVGVGLPDFKLAMTPENIKPLLENSKEVYARLHECIAEIKVLLTNTV